MKLNRAQRRKLNMKPKSERFTQLLADLHTERRIEQAKIKEAKALMRK